MQLFFPRAFAHIKFFSYGQEMRSLNARERHLKLMSDYQGMRDSAVAASAALNARLPTISDLDLLKQEHRYVQSFLIRFL